MFYLSSEFSPGGCSYGIFASIQPTEFKRVISNLINNAVESLGETGKVTVELLSLHQEDNLVIKISDNGQGIPPEVLKKLGQMGETHGKKDGNGLGLYHARKSILAWNGEVSIESALGLGTTVSLILPRAKAPPWFVPELELEENGTVVILDDDNSIHQVWQGRLKALSVTNFGIKTLHFSTPQQVIDWIQEHRIKSNVLYLFDYELIGYEQTGLDLIQSLNLGPKSILVTSHFEEKDILKKCGDLNVKILPKSMAEFVPLKISSARKPVYDVVYIDDGVP